MLALTTTHEAQPVPIKAPIQIEQLQPKSSKLPNFDIEVLEPLRADQKAEADKLAAEAAERLKQAQIEAAKQIQPTFAPIYSSGSGTLVGSIGYARAGGNCVNEPGVNNPGFGNPISWAVLSQSPTIGATVLFTYNHTGVITGLWSNGDIEIRHQNVTGGVHRYPRSAFRGFR